MSQRISFSRNSDLSSVELNLLADLSRLIVTAALSLHVCKLMDLMHIQRIDLILEWCVVCCTAPLAVVPGRAAPLGVEIDAVVVRVPSHVVPVRKGCHRQWRRHLHACSLVFDTEYLLHRLLACIDNILERSEAGASKDLRKSVQALARVPHSLVRVRRSNFNTS